MNDKNDEYDLHFFQLVFSLQAGAMQQMGKMTSTLTGKIERDLSLAKASIDMLDMIQRKTEGNLTPDEKRLLEHTLYELRLNYVEEVKKGDSESEETNEAKETPEKEEKPEKSKDSPEKPAKDKDENGGSKGKK